MPGRDPFSDDQITAMLDSRAFGIGDRNRNHCLFIMELCTGGRINELLKLTRRDVIDDFGRIREEITFKNTKNHDSRTVPIVNDWLTPIINSWLINLQTRGHTQGRAPLFPGQGRRRNITCRHAYRIYVTAVKELRFSGSYGTHSCRKTWARETYNHYHRRRLAGELIDPLVKLQEAGGWKTIDAARRYLSFMLGDVKESQAAIFSKFRKTSTNEAKEKVRKLPNEILGRLSDENDAKPNKGPK